MIRKPKLVFLVKSVMALAFIFMVASGAVALDFAHVKDRVEVDREIRSPLVAHVTVVLCTNRAKVTDYCHQDRKDTNIYWGGKRGVKTHFGERDQWQKLTAKKPEYLPILERVVFKRYIENVDAEVYLVADVWRGGDVKKAITYFLTMSSGKNVEKLSTGDELIYAGGQSHVVAYMGHNGIDKRHLLLELDPTTNPNSAIVFGRGTAATFTQALDRVGSYPLLLTDGVMTPQADILEAALTTWFTTTSPAQVRNATAEAYARSRGGSVSASLKKFVAGVP